MATYKGHNEDSSGNILLSIGNGMTATVETGSTASQAYTKGAYIFFNNRFCKATKAISSGATLAIGNNLSETSVGAELTSHLRASNGDEFYFDYKDSKPGYYPSASKVASQFVPFGGSHGLDTDLIDSEPTYEYVIGNTSPTAYTTSRKIAMIVLWARDDRGTSVGIPGDTPLIFNSSNDLVLHNVADYSYTMSIRSNASAIRMYIYYYK